MATIKNVIETKFTTAGAGNTVNSIESLNKAQTRLGQSSASAGRSFAAQSQGMGGLVAAYAGAAATIFSLQQAYSALAKSAQAAQTMEGLKTLAAVSGESGTQLLASVREITKGQLTLAESAAQINASLSAGFSGEQIERLSSVALKASRALGRDLNDAYTRVIRGSAKMETELLDELGIYTKIEPATRAYAAAMGKSVTQLTEFERRQAFANAVIAEGERKFSAINTTIPTTAEQIEAFGTKIIDVATQLGMALANIIAPLASFLTENLAGAFSTVGIAAGLAASKGISVLTGSLTNLSDSLERRADSIRDKFASWSTAGKQAQADIQDSIRKITLAGKAGLTKSNVEIAPIIKTAEERGLTTKEASLANKLLDERKNKLESIITKETQYLDLQKAKVAALEADGKTSTATYTKATKELERQTNQLKNTNALYAETTTAIDNIGKASQLAGTKTGSLLGGIVSGGTRAIGSIGSLGASFVSLGASALSAVSILSLLGTVIASAIGKQEEYNALLAKGGSLITNFFTNKDAQNAEKTFLSLAGASLTNLEKVNTNLRETDKFTFTTKILGIEVDVTKTKEDLIREVSDAFSVAARSGEKTWGESLGTYTAVGTAIGGAIGAGIGFAFGGVGAPLGAKLGALVGGAAGTTISKLVGDEIKKLDATIKSSLEAQYGTGIFTGAQGAQLEQVLQIIEEQAGATKNLSFEARQYYETQQQIAISTGKNLNNFRELAYVADQLGLEASVVESKFSKVAKTIDGIDLKPLLNLDDIDITINIVNQEEVLKRADALRKRALELAKPPEQYMVTSAVTTPTTYDEFGGGSFNIAMEAGNATAQLELMNSALQQQQKEISAVEGNLRLYKTQLEVLRNISPSDRTDEQNEALRRLQREIPSTASQLNVLTEALGEATAARDLFEKRFTSPPGAAQSANAINLFNDALMKVETSSNDASISAAKLENIFFDLSQSVKAGTIDLERLSQGEGAASKVFDSLIIQSAEAKVALESAVAARDLLAAQPESAAQRDLLSAADAELAILKQRVTDTENLVKAEYSRFEALIAANDPLREQLQLASELKTVFGDLTKEQVSRVGVISSSGKVITSEIEKQAELQAYLTGIVDSGKVAYANQQLQIAGINTLLTTQQSKYKLTTVQATALLSATRDNVDEKLQELGITGEVADAVRAVVLNTSDQAKEAENVTTALTVQENQLINNMKRAAELTQEFTKQRVEVEAQIAEIRKNAEISALKIKFELENISFDAVTNSIESTIKSLQNKINLINAKVDNKKLDPVNAAKEIAKIQQEILDREVDLEKNRYAQAEAAAKQDLQILAKEVILAKERIQAEKNNTIAKINSDMALIQGLDATNKNLVDSLNSIFESATSALASIFGGFLGAFGKGGIENPFTKVDYVSTISEAVSAGEALIGTVEEYATAQIDAESQRFKDAEALYRAEASLRAQIHNNNIKDIDERRLVETEAGEAAIRAAKEAGAASADELKKLQEKYEDLISGMADKLQEAVSTVIGMISEKLIANQQAKVDSLKSQEELATGIVAFQTERLNQAQSKLSEALSKETSLKEELIDVTNTLAESQKGYIASLGDLDARNIAASSKQFITDLIAQKRKTIEVGAAVRSRIALEEEVKSLEQTKIEVEQYLEEVTNARIAAEEKLAKLQERLAAVADIASGKIGNLVRSLSGFGFLSGGTGGNVLSAFVGKITGLDAVGNVAKDINEAGTALNDIASRISAAQMQTMQTQNNLGGLLNKASEGLQTAIAKFGDSTGVLSKIAGPLSSIASGFGIGSAVGMLTGDTTMGSSIGGAIGKLIAGTKFGAAITGGIGKAISGVLGKTLGTAAGSALGAVASFALPVVGALIGGLIGKLFKKRRTPRASATGEFTEDGFEMLSSYEKRVPGGTAKSLLSISDTVLTSITSSLKQLGISFKDTIQTSISMYNGAITGASLTYVDKVAKSQSSNFADTVLGRFFSAFAKTGTNGITNILSSVSSNKVEGTTFKSGNLGSGQDAAQKAAEFYGEAFFEGLRVIRDAEGFVQFRSLVVDALTPNASDVQAALDFFAELSDTSLKTQQRFTKVLEFAGKFSKTVTDLLGSSAVTAERVYPLVEEAARENAYAILKYYEKLTEDTAEAFGTNSSQYRELTRSLELNALALIGLTKAADGTVVSLDDAASDLNAGALAIKNIVATTEAMTSVFEGLGYTAAEAAEVVEKGLTIKLSEFVKGFGDSVKDALDLLENPDSRSVRELEAVITNSKERISQAQGVYNELLATQRITASKAATANEALLLTRQNILDTDGKIAAQRDKQTALARLLAEKQAKYNSAEYQYYRNFTTGRKYGIFGPKQYPFRYISNALAAEITALQAQSAEAATSITTLSTQRADLLVTQVAIEKAVIAFNTSVAQLDPIITDAANNVTQAIALQAAEIDTYLRQLTKGQLRAVIAATDTIDILYREAAANRLLALEANDAAEAFKNFVGITRDFKKSLSEITGVDFVATYANSIGSLFVLAEKLGKTEIDDTVRQFGSLLTNISSGNNVAANFSSAISLLVSEFDGGATNAEYFIQALDTLQKTTVETINVLKNLVDGYKDTIAKLRDAYQESKDILVDAVQNFGDSILKELDNFAARSVEILQIYDGIINDITTSGNSLLDLKDDAAKALQDAKQAVLDFEKANKLTGRSSSQIREEIARIEAQINSLLASPITLSSFREYSALSATQMGLRNELTNLTAKEAEYTKLLEARSIAESDLAKTNQIIADLGSSLVDSRNAETETIQKAIELQQQFTKAQQDRVLAEERLAAAGFNLNQVRIDETDKIVQLDKALLSANTSLNTIRSSLADISNADTNLSAVKTELLAAARASAEVLYAGLPEAERLAKIQSAVSQAESSFNSIRDVILNTASAIASSGSLMPSINAISTSQAETISSATSNLVTLVNAFTGANVNGISNLTLALNNFADTSNQILAVDGLSSSIAALNTVSGSSSEKVSMLITNLQYLSDRFAQLGYNISPNSVQGLAALENSLVSTAVQIQAAWDALTFEFSSNVQALQQAVGSMNVTGSVTIQEGSTVGLSETNSMALDSIAANTRNFPYLVDVGREKYAVGQYASGGFVGRDRVLSLLEPGEFVLRKAAVEKIGVDNAIKLNSTGSIDSSGDVQVNITNNGTPVETVGAPDIRRVNGKIVVDILLEDLRNNGPIKRQIRSIR